MSRSTASVLLAALMAVSFSSLAAAAEVSDDVTYFLRRDDCGTDFDNEHLSTTAGSDSEGCGFLAGPANELLGQVGDPLIYAFAQDDGVTYTLDGEGTVTGTIATSGFLGDGSSAGLVTVEVEVTARVGNARRVLASITDTAPAALEDPVVSFSAPVDAAFAGADVSSLRVDVIIRGAHANTVPAMSGASFVDLPILVDDQT